MKISFKTTVLRQNRNKDNTYPVYIRIGFKSKYEFLRTDLYVSAKDLDKKMNIKSELIKRKGSVLEYEYQDRIEKSNVKFEDVKQVRSFLENNEDEGVNYTKYFIKYIEGLRQKNSPSLSIYKATFNHFSDFSPNVMAGDITPKFLLGFENYLIEQKVGSRGVELYLGKVRAVFNKMMEDYDHVAFRYPFKKYKIPKSKTRKTVALTKEQLLSIINCEPKGVEGLRARDIFIISLLTLGTNAKDLYMLDTINNNRIEYRRSKTSGKRADEAFISIRIEVELTPFLKKHKGANRIFNFSEIHAKPERLNKAISRGMKEIKLLTGIPDLVFYDARRTIASVMRNKLGISKDDVAMCLNHVDMTHKTTDIYIETDFSILDKCNRKFLNWLFKQR